MKRFFHNTLFSSIDALVLVVLNLIATPILLKHLGVAEYGVFVFLSIFSTYGLLSLFDLGMEGALLNYVARFDAARDKQRIQDSLTVSLLFYGAIGLVLGVIMYLAADFIVARFIDEEGALNQVTVLAAIHIVAVNIVLQFLTLPFTAVLQGLRRYVVTKSVNTVMTVFRYTLIIVVAIWYQRIDIAFLVILCITILKLLVMIFIVRFKLDYFRPLHVRIRPDILKSLFSYSSVLFVSRIIGIIFRQMDKFLIWLFLAVTQMALYDIVVRPANLMRMLLSILNSAVVPEVARLHHNKEIARIRALYIALVKYAYLVLLPILAIAYTHMGFLLHIWVGARFSPYRYMVSVIITVFLVAPIVSVASTVVVGLELVRKTIWISIVASVINITLSLVLLQFMGLIGLLVATLAADVFMVVPYLFMMTRILDMRAWDVLKPALKLIATAVPFLLINEIITHTLPGGAIPWALVICGLMALHFYTNFRYHLTPQEKRYALERIGIRRSEAAPKAMRT